MKIAEILLVECEIKPKKENKISLTRPNERIRFQFVHDLHKKINCKKITKLAQKNIN